MAEDRRIAAVVEGRRETLRLQDLHSAEIADSAVAAETAEAARIQGRRGK